MRTIVVTGVTGLVGRVLVKHFLGSGDVVIGLGRSPDSLAKLKKELQETSQQLYCMSVDLSSEDACDQIRDFLLTINLLPDCLVNNARDSSYLRVNSSGNVSRSDFMGELLLDIVVPYELTMALAQQPQSMLRSVVNIGSQYGIVAPNLTLYSDPVKDSAVHYGVAKAGVVHLTKELAVRLAHQDIRVNCVAFGGVEGRVQDDFRKRYSRLTPIGRMLNESDLSGPVDLLLSPTSSGITGHTLVVDGGWSIW
jgi:NAD(P)-dependent dehydrogenase (short-subunit alcohol dehydrogenase family)